MQEESTTPDLREIIRRVFETFSRGDLDESIGFFAPDAVWDAELGASRGRAAIRAMWEEYAGSVGDLQIEVEEIIDFGHGILMAVTSHRAHPGGSEHEVRAREAYVYECSAGQIDRVTPLHDDDDTRAFAERLAESRS